MKVKALLHAGDVWLLSVLVTIAVACSAAMESFWWVVAAATVVVAAIGYATYDRAAFDGNFLRPWVRAALHMVVVAYVAIGTTACVIRVLAVVHPFETPPATTEKSGQPIKEESRERPEVLAGSTVGIDPACNALPSDQQSDCVAAKIISELQEIAAKQPDKLPAGTKEIVTSMPSPPKPESLKGYESKVGASLKKEAANNPEALFSKLCPTPLAPTCQLANLFLGGLLSAGVEVKRPQAILKSALSGSGGVATVASVFRTIPPDAQLKFAQQLPEIFEELNGRANDDPQAICNELRQATDASSFVRAVWPKPTKDKVLACLDGLPSG